MSDRQLSLFKGKRQQGAAARPPLEFEMQCVVADTLRRFLTPGWIWQHIPGGEERPAEYRNGVRVSFAGARLQRAGFQPGWPDFLLFAPGGRPHCIELKRRGGRVSEHQAAFALWCKLNSVPHAFCDSVPAALELLGQWGALRRGIRPQ